MSKTYEALLKAEQLRAAQDPAALARRVARTVEEGQTLRAELGDCQQQLAALVERIDAAAASDDDLGRQVARLAAQQERLAAEPRQRLEAAIAQLRGEIDRRWAGVQSQADDVAGLSLRLTEVQEGVVPALEAIRRELDQLQRNAGQLQRVQQTQDQAVAATLEPLREAMAHARAAVDEQRREQRRLVDELAAVRDAQQDGVRQAQRLVALSESFESVSGRLENVEALRRADTDRLQADVRSVQEGVDRLRVALAESEAASAADNATKVDALRAAIEALREQLTAIDDDGRRQQREQAEGLPSLSAPMMHVVQESVDSLQAAQQGLGERLAAIEDIQSRSDRRSHDMLAEVESLLTGQTRSASEIEVLRGQLAGLAEARSRQQQLAESVERAHATAQEAARRTTAIDAAHASSLALLQQRIAELQTDMGTLRDALGAIQSPLAEQLEMAAGIETLRTQLQALTEAQARQDKLAHAVSRAQSAADEAGRRIGASEETQSAALAGLRQQVDALQADSGNWRDVFVTVQAVLHRQTTFAGGVDALRTQVTRMVEDQQRQQQLFEDLVLAPPSIDEADEALVSANSGKSAELATLRRQVAALQADRMTLDAFLEMRFEVLCGIVDAEMQTKLDEIRGGVRGPIASGRRLAKRLSEPLARLTSSLAGRVRRHGRGSQDPD